MGKKRDKEMTKSAVNQCLQQSEMLKEDKDRLAEFSMTTDCLK